MKLPIAGLALGALLAAGCQDPDVGQPCNFDLDTSASTNILADYLETGKTECENLVCIKSPPLPQGSAVKNNPYCSKPCVSNADCSQSDTGLVCRAVVIDPAFVQSLPPDKQKYLGGVQFSNYCAAPLQ